MSRVSARVVDSDDLQGAALIAHARLVITGATGKRLHEQVIRAGGQLVDGRFRAFRADRDVEALLSSSTDEPAPTALSARVIAGWTKAEGALYAAIEQRGRTVRESILKRLERQRLDERAAIAERMSELRGSIADRLHELEGPNVQLELDLNSEEQAQWSSDRDALRDRLARIPDEIDAEQANIDRRYATPADRVFPAAVSILIPRSMLKGPS